MESIYKVAGALLSQYIEELAAVQDARALSTFELISLERQLTPRLHVSRERLEAHQRLSMPSGRL